MNKKRFSEAHPKQNIWLFYTVWSVHLFKLPCICYYFLNTNSQKNNELFKKRFENYKCKSFSTCSRPQNALYNLNLSIATASNLGPKWISMFCLRRQNFFYKIDPCTSNMKLFFNDFKWFHKVKFFSQKKKSFFNHLQMKNCKIALFEN